MFIYFREKNYMIPTLLYTDNDKKLARNIAKIAVRALYFEVKAYPKPGLVSFIDSGSHDDMNGETFYRSLFSLRHYFYHIIMQGLSNQSFDQLKETALQAEEKMLMATHGINTHRGAVFSLGIFCVSTAKLIKTKAIFSPMDLHHQIMNDWEKVLENHSTAIQSNGNIVSRKHMIIGAKEMAIQGYPIIFQLFPSFHTLFETTQCINTSCLYAYLSLLTQIDDTNILHRKGMTGLKEARQKAQEILLISCLKTRQKKAMALHYSFSSERISPGGVGDLIGVLLFLSQLYNDKIQ